MIVIKEFLNPFAQTRNHDNKTKQQVVMGDPDYLDERNQGKQEDFKIESLMTGSRARD
jgi:hypothetical protein